MDIPFFLIIGVGLATFAFTLGEFCDLMRRHDDEFPGRYDKPIWAAAIIFGNVIGAFAFWLCKPVAPSSNESLRQQYERPDDR